MTVLWSHPLTENFLGVRSLQANGSNPSGDSSPAGNGTQLQIVDGWMRATVSEADAVFAGGHRAEITGADDVVPSERLYRWEYRIIGAWPYNSTEFVLMQIHSNPSGAVVAENFWITCDGTTIRALVPASLPGDVTSYRCIASWPAVVGEINRMALHVSWDKTANRQGSMALYRNAQIVATVRGMATAYSHAEAGGPYFKLGCYMPSHAYSGWGVRMMEARNVIVSDNLNGESWTTLLGDIPRPVPWAVGP